MNHSRFVKTIRIRPFSPDNPFWGVFLFSLFLIFSACEKWDIARVDFPEVATQNHEFSQISTEIKLFGEISGLLEPSFVQDHGHLLSENDPIPSIESNSGQTSLGKKGNGIFSSEFKDLTPGKAYFYRAYAIYEGKVIYGEIHQITTNVPNINVEIDSIIKTATFTLRVLSSISQLNPGSKLKSFGLAWGEHPSPVIESDQFVAEQGIVVTETAIQFEEEIEIFPGENYLRPFVAIGEATFYGGEKIHSNENVWRERAGTGHALNYAVGFAIGNKGYIGTGRGGDGMKADFWEYDPDKNTWTQKADFGGGPREQAAGFAIGNKGYIGGGEDEEDEERADFWEYDPEKNVWTQKADFAGGEEEEPIGFTIGNKGYMGMSEDEDNFWEYDPEQDLWTKKADFEVGSVDDGFSLAIGNKGYVKIPSGFWEYSPEQDLWSQKEDPEFSCQAGFAIGSKGYFYTGAPDSLNYDFWEYDPQMNRWTPKANFAGSERDFSVGFSIGTRGYIGMGRTNILLKTDLWEYTPEDQ